MTDTHNMTIGLNELKKQQVVKLSDIDHVLIRPSRYIGSIEPVLETCFVLNEQTGLLEYKEIQLRPAIRKCFLEILENSIDECAKCRKAKLKGIGDRIDITLDGSKISVEDNGRGIPVEQNAHKEWIPELCWTSLRAGSKFSDNSAEIGQNGEGASIVAIFSKTFIGESYDGKCHFKMVCSDNLKNKKIDVKSTSKHGTLVTFELGGQGIIKLPEGDKSYNMDILSEELKNNPVYISLFMSEIAMLAIAYPDINFRVNGKTIKFKKFVDFANMLGTEENVEFQDAGPIKIAVAQNPSAKENFIQRINGINAMDGGGPIDWVIGNITQRILDKLQRQYKNIKASDVRNHLTFAAFFNGLPNPRFSNQIKTHCVNTASQFKEITNEVDFDKLAKQILKNDKLIDPMIETYKIKEEYEKRKALAGADKDIAAKKVRPKNYIPANNYNEFLVLTEGESAKYGIIEVLGRDNFGFFALRGKALNCHEADIKKIADNKEIIAIRQILGINLARDNTKLAYEKILIASDQDVDGIHIRSLVLTMFNRLAKEYVKRGNIKVLRTPLVTLNDSKGRIVHYFFDLQSLAEWKSKHSSDRLTENYFKGLGKWGGENARLLLELIERDGLGNFIIDLVWDETTDQMFDAWMGGDTTKRKEFLMGKSFDVSIQ